MIFREKSGRSSGYIRLFSVDDGGEKNGLIKTWNGSGTHYGNDLLLKEIEK